MVVAKSMLDAPLEFPNVATSILTSMHSTPMTLPIRPFPSINITRIKPVNAKSMPEALPIVSTVTASSRPRLDSIAIILAINPIPLVPPTHVIVIDSASRTFALMKLPLVHISVAINLNPTPRV